MTAHTTFRGLQLREPIPFNRFFHDGRTIANINVTEDTMADAEFDIETADNYEPWPKGLAANFGTAGPGDNAWFSCGRVEARTYKKTIPKWCFNDTEIRRLIEHSFPNWRKKDTVRADAARWAAVIQLYRMGYTSSQIATEIGSNPCKVRGVIRSIQRAAKGLRAGSAEPRTKRGGRVKKPKISRLFDRF